MPFFRAGLGEIDRANVSDNSYLQITDTNKVLPLGVILVGCEVLMQAWDFLLGFSMMQSA